MWGGRGTGVPGHPDGTLVPVSRREVGHGLVHLLHRGPCHGTVKPASLSSPGGRGAHLLRTYYPVLYYIDNIMLYYVKLHFISLHTLYHVISYRMILLDVLDSIAC